MPSTVKGEASAAMASKQRRAQFSKKPEAPSAQKPGQPHMEHDLRKRVLKTRHQQKTDVKELLQSASQALPWGEAETKAGQSIRQHVPRILHQGIRSSMVEHAGQDEKQTVNKNYEQNKEDNVKKNDEKSTGRSTSADVTTSEEQPTVSPAFGYGEPYPDTQDRYLMREWLTTRMMANMPAVQDAARRMMEAMGVSNQQPDFPLPGPPLPAGMQPIRGRMIRWGRLGEFQSTLVKSMQIWDLRPQLTSKNITYPAREPGKLQAAIPTASQMQLTLRTGNGQFARLIKIALPGESDPKTKVEWIFFDLQMPLLACQEKPPVELTPIPNGRLLFGFPKQSMLSTSEPHVFQPRGPPVVEFNEKQKMRYRTSKYKVFKKDIQSSAYLQSENQVAVFPAGASKADLERRKDWWDSFHEGQLANKSRWEHIFRHMALGNIKIIMDY